MGNVIFTADYDFMRKIMNRCPKLEIWFEVDETTGRNCLTVMRNNISLEINYIEIKGIKIRYDQIFEVRCDFYENDLANLIKKEEGDYYESKLKLA